MDREELRQRQRPLKDRYRQEPGAAMVTPRAEGSLADDGAAYSVQTGRVTSRWGQVTWSVSLSRLSSWAKTRFRPPHGSEHTSGFSN